jgi:hypothetical protein
MNVLQRDRFDARTVNLTQQRRWRVALFAGLLLFLALGGYALVVGPGTAQSTRAVPVLVAAQDIRAGTTITEAALRTTSLRPDDRGLLVTLVAAGDRSKLVGQTAAVSVPAGHLLPAGIASPRATAGLWVAAVPIKRMPAGLKAGDHVALLTEAPNKVGQPTAFVIMQDVEVVHIAGNQVDLWLPAKLAPQIEWYADHGGLVLLKMQPGAVQQDLPAAGGL